MDFNQRPFTVVWETTRACDLAGIHCRAEARALRDPSELNFAEAQGLIQDVKAFGSPYPIFVLTGGDPAKRPDIFDIIKYTRSEGLRVALTLLATPLITGDPMRSDPYCVYQPVQKERNNANGKSRPSGETDVRALNA